MTDAKREALVRKIKAMQEKTVANGCTEQEATNAAAMTQRLMSDYGLSLEEIEASQDKDELCETGSYQTGLKHSSPIHPVQYTMGGIAAWTHTKTWRNGSRLKFFGLNADVQVAVYLADIFKVALETEWKRYWKEYKYYTTDAPITARKGFMLGMAQRLRNRLIKMAKERAEAEGAPESDSRALVVVKQAIVEHAYDELGLKLHKASYNRYQGSGHHLLAGRDAGERVHIPAAGLGQGQGAPKRIS